MSETDLDRFSFVQVYLELKRYVEVSRNAYMKLDEIKKLNHPILDLNDVFCVQGD